MPKMKTHRGAAKRFSRTGTGKIKYKRMNLRHCLEQKGKTRKKRLVKPAYMAPCDARRVNLMLGK